MLSNSKSSQQPFWTSCTQSQTQYFQISRRNAEFLSQRYLDVTLANDFNGTDSGTITVNVRGNVSLPTNDNVIHIVINENDISYITAPNGVTHPDDVMRYMITGGDGEAISVAQNQMTTVIKGYNLQTRWKKENCYLTVFVQSTSTKAVYGVERIKMSN